jgi:hypothetical protein
MYLNGRVFLYSCIFLSLTDIAPSILRLQTKIYSLAFPHILTFVKEYISLRNFITFLFLSRRHVCFINLFHPSVRKTTAGFRYCRLQLCWKCAEVLNARKYKFDMFLTLTEDQSSKRPETFCSYLKTLQYCFL